MELEFLGLFFFICNFSDFYLENKFLLTKTRVTDGMNSIKSLSIGNSRESCHVIENKIKCNA